MAMGTPTTIAPPVTYRLATIMGRIPNTLLDGLHSVPVRNFSGPIFAMAGSPLANRKKQIRNTARTEVHAANRKINFIPFSLKPDIFSTLFFYSIRQGLPTQLLLR